MQKQSWNCFFISALGIWQCFSTSFAFTRLWRTSNAQSFSCIKISRRERMYLNFSENSLFTNKAHEFTEELVCKVHELVLGESMGTVGELSGEYRRNSIYVGGLNCPSWELVPSLVNELIKYVQRGPLKGIICVFIRVFLIARKSCKICCRVLLSIFSNKSILGWKRQNWKVTRQFSIAKIQIPTHFLWSLFRTLFYKCNKWDRRQRSRYMGKCNWGDTNG